MDTEENQMATSIFYSIVLSWEYGPAACAESDTERNASSSSLPNKKRKTVLTPSSFPGSEKESRAKKEEEDEEEGQTHQQQQQYKKEEEKTKTISLQGRKEAATTEVKVDEKEAKTEDLLTKKGGKKETAGKGWSFKKAIGLNQNKKRNFTNMNASNQAKRQLMKEEFFPVDLFRIKRFHRDHAKAEHLRYVDWERKKKKNVPIVLH
ncbi:hypothetical protein RFI_19329 [Reticulomyxa filosa]|uniref:Uncharacterized protein n=1 Tax=Reticulomyxa filosa TaxID=46433 RepID=X6MVX5_RETFI|nr:hypothetical protein RFI_19329 [Reticulomyxa filosa]|eukprot:ETO17974.1 hypothetical protein RFI_19329 [Reticulomyxa filosa]